MAARHREIVMEIGSRNMHHSRDRKERIMRLREEAKEQESRVAQTRHEIGLLKYEVSEAARRIQAFNRPEWQYSLDKLTLKLEAARRRLPILEEALAKNQDALEAMQAPPLSDSEREAAKAQFTALEARRMEIADKLEDLMEKARALGDNNLALTTQMQTLAESLELDFSDGSHFDSLAQQQAWHASYFPDLTNARQYIVTAEELDLKPSVEGCGLWVAGETIRLNDQDAAPLLAKGTIALASDERKPTA